MNFEVDNRIRVGSFRLGNWPLSSIYLKDNADFPWVILIPQEPNIQEIYQLSTNNRAQLMNEITALSKVMDDFFKPDKLNMGALGNIVPQLHIHIVARYRDDKCWPHSIWQPDVPLSTYRPEHAEKLIQTLKEQLANIFILR
ncbi:HIT family protein [Legionella jamestowniensis]|uniref:Diadenosine tetraphosphatase n=1 Tax=Legionella jamestowniensis TaxID=455 RepID=A0A0W0V055_9GAMM|nr:HIT family protein [Legionella jamestowniensis]KTD13309.1 diadenosine tetraphosphate (Ap4A) hydrolase-like HIT family hydrolase [Legionella jamestowniensis]OCH98337.1 diadenosine tetraphosphatase [Legionella jamestowniensis]SFL77297.1 Diadenosine tetraphosphate (Ap4A) hydrolase [Legionella jamestowniensis DSM 19215]